ncbi:universal stress protein [Rhodovulum sp. DZ06]|uniref:universal stress protein n=1 Tax=Rhodovulum sp. DZ06 TaxID=3425126 RepID=UPI003D3418BC
MPATPIASILIASDLSARSDRALQRGFRLARALGAKVSVVAAVDDDAPGPLSSEIAAKTRAHLSAAAAQLAGDVPHEVKVETGDPVSLLLAHVNAGGHDLAVFGRHRSRGALDGLRPSTVESVLSHARIPALIAAGPVHDGYARALAATGFSPACLRAATLARALAPGAELRVAHMWTAPFEGLSGGADSPMSRAVKAETEAQAAAWAAGAGEALPQVELSHGGLGAGLHGVIAAFKPDLLAIGAHTRSLSFTGLGGFAAELLRDPPCDLLITRGAAG